MFPSLIELPLIMQQTNQPLANEFISKNANNTGNTVAIREPTCGMKFNTKARNPKNRAKSTPNK